jgi:O-antigen/teichoic acid export membrane protein
MWLTALLSSLVWSRGEYPIVRAMLADQGIATYAAAMAIFGGALQGVMLGVSAIAPYLTRLIGEGRRTTALAVARRVMDFQLLACGLAALSLSLLGPELLTLAFGDRFTGAAPALAVLSIAVVSLALSAQNHLLQIQTDGRYTRNAAIVGAAMLFGLALVLIPSGNLVGAALARALTMLALAAASVVLTGMKWGFDAVSIKNFLIVTVMVTLASGINGLALPTRAAFLGLAVAALTAFLRDRDGVPLVVLAVRRVLPAGRVDILSRSSAG